MCRLTQKDEQGNWCVKGLEWEQLHVGQVITQNVWEKLYGALWKLVEYEGTGLTPERIEELNGFEKTQTAHCLAALQEEQRKHRWIPVEERLPEENGLYVVAIMGEGIAGPIYVRDLTDYENESGWYAKNVVAWLPQKLPKPYCPETLREAGKESGQDAAAQVLQSAT